RQPRLALRLLISPVPRPGFGEVPTATPDHCGEFLRLQILGPYPCPWAISVSALTMSLTPWMLASLCRVSAYLRRSSSGVLSGSRTVGLLSQGATVARGNSLIFRVSCCNYCDKALLRNQLYAIDRIGSGGRT